MQSENDCMSNNKVVARAIMSIVYACCECNYSQIVVNRNQKLNKGYMTSFFGGVKYVTEDVTEDVTESDHNRTETNACMLLTQMLHY